MCRQLQAEGVPASRIARVYNGIDLSRFAIGHGPQQGDGPVIGMLANFRHPVKDYSTFLRAAQRVRRAMPTARFVLAGEGELLPAMQSLASELGLAGCSRFTGAVRNVPELLSAWDICVLTSRSEGFSNAVLEYMAAGRPTVCTDVSGAREAILDGVTGFIVPIGDALAVADRILELGADPRMARDMGLAARHRVEGHFSLAQQTASISALYERLCRGKNVAGFEKTPWTAVE